MMQWVTDLLALQEVDMRIKNLKQRLSMIPQEIKSRNAELKKFEDKLKSKREELNKNSLSIKQVESSIKQKNDEINRLQSQSSQIKKNNEYQALMKQIDDVRAAIGELETKEIELLDRVQEDDNLYKEYEKEVKAESQSIHEEMGELNQMVAEIKEEVQKQEETRPALSKKLEPEVINIYSRLLAKAGQPLVKVSAGNCGHCHMKLIPQTMHNAQKGAIAICDQCAHMLYVD